ncbi:hypothetical protein LguiA_023280 [Lonicera macranthoides]
MDCKEGNRKLGTRGVNSKVLKCGCCSTSLHDCISTALKTPGGNNIFSVTVFRIKEEKRNPCSSTCSAQIGGKWFKVILDTDHNSLTCFEMRFRVEGLGFSPHSNEMLVHFRHRIGSHPSNNPLYSILNPLRNQRIKLPRTLTLEMASQLPPKRLMCPSCSKPARICLCARMKTPIIDNSVSVTIVQHKLEKNHPLNSTRIATIGLKNLNLVWVSDVNPQAQFHLIQSNSTVECNLIDSIEEPDLTFIIEKHGHIDSQRPNFNQLLASLVACDGLNKGFVVRKFTKKQLNGRFEDKEFEIEVPCGSVLLFPSEESVGVEDIDFEVKNLIVLDGTWAKAKRMYSENPWLMLLPHLKLDLDKLSLYGEVRNQPRAGYLSSIESIVYALKAVGENPGGLDGLLDVFESMVGDQRRCKYERLSKASSI